MPTPTGRESMMDAILKGEKPRMVIGGQSTDWIGDGTHSPIDGSFHSTKDSYLGHLKENGCHITDASTKDRREKIKSKNDRELKQAKKDMKEWSEGRIW